MGQFTKRQQQIIDVSIKIIAGQGIQNLTIKNISNEIQLTEAAIYRHFNSKFNILDGILSSFESIASDVFNEMDEPNLKPLERINYFLMDRYRRFSEYPDLAKVMFSEAVFQDDERLANKVVSIMHQHKENMVKYIISGQKSGEIRGDIEPKELFRIIVGSMRLLVNQWCFKNFSFDLIAEGKKLWESINKIII